VEISELTGRKRVGRKTQHMKADAQDIGPARIHPRKKRRNPTGASPSMKRGEKQFRRGKDCKIRGNQSVGKKEGGSDCGVSMGEDGFGRRQRFDEKKLKSPRRWLKKATKASLYMIRSRATSSTKPGKRERPLTSYNRIRKK